MDKAVETYFSTAGQFEEALRTLGEIARAAGLAETYKWRNPCYTYNNKNVVILGVYKGQVSMTFFKGVLLKDSKQLLAPITEHVQADRILKLRGMDQLNTHRQDIHDYILEAIEVEKLGKKIPMKTTDDYEVPDELLDIFSEIPEFKDAFYELTPGRQRGYLLHYAGAKQSKTRTSRIEKSMDRVYDGKGLNDCICGHSKKMPRCDGSHKRFQ